MLLSDTFHLLGFNIFDRKRVMEARKLEKQRKLIGGFASKAGAGPLQPVLQASNQIYKSQRLRTQASIQDSPQKPMDNSPLPHQPGAADGSNKYRNNSSMVYGNGAGENSTASTGMSGSSGISNGANPSLASNQKQKSRYVISPTKFKKGDSEGLHQYGSGADDQVRLMGSPEKFKVKDKMAIASFL